MAKIVLGIGMSHSPMMAMEGKNWYKFAEFDYKHPKLFDQEGNSVTFSELDQKVQSKYVNESTPEVLVEQYTKMRQMFDRLHVEFEEHKPDCVIVIGNDHPGEWLSPSNVPALGVFYGDKVISAKIKFPRAFDFRSDVLEEAAVGMGMDDHHVWPGSKDVALQLINSLMEQNFDVAAMKEVEDPSIAGHGHGYGMVVTELMRENLIPMVPIYLNTWPPNELSPSRCYDLGIAIRKAVESMPEDLKVAIIATGGLSHFVTDKDLDEYVLNALKERDEKALRDLPRHRLMAGSSEIRNWVVLGAVIRDMELAWAEYIPVFRTSAGTGLGMGFARWS